MPRFYRSFCKPFRTSLWAYSSCPEMHPSQVHTDLLPCFPSSNTPPPPKSGSLMPLHLLAVFFAPHPAPMAKLHQRALSAHALQSCSFLKKLY